jgi:hypothetical protein
MPAASPGAHRLIKAQHHIFKRIGQPSLCPPGKWALAAASPHQARIVAQQLVWLLAMANPQPLRHFLIPGQRTAAAVDLHRQAVFSRR